MYPNLTALVTPESKLRFSHSVGEFRRDVKRKPIGL
jgi:hypothetical protein